MPTRKYIILLSGLFFGLIFLPFSAKAQEEGLAEMLTTPLVTITGYNVLCEGDQDILTATTALAAASFRWYKDGVEIPGEITDAITINPTNPETVFSVAVLDAGGEILGTAQRRVFVTTRPIVTEANRVNDVRCPYDYYPASIVGMRNTTANFFIWSFDPDVNPHMVGDTINPWTPPPTTDSINVHVWYQNNMNKVVRTVFTVQMSTHSLRAIGYDNRCYTIDSAMIEIGTADFEVVASEPSVCVDETITLNITGDIVDNSIVWSTGHENTRSISARIVAVGDTTFLVEGVDSRGCPGVSSVTVYGTPTPRNVRIVVDDPIVCEGLSTRLTVECDDCGDEFVWDGNRLDGNYIDIWPVGRFVHTVRAYGGPNLTGCYASAAIEILAINCEAIHFPTAIRLSSQIPGNNEWRPRLAEQEGTQYWFAIFNQWGELIFESPDMNVGWDGTHNGQFVRPGTYVFLFRLTHIHRTWERTGTITVIE